MNQARNKDLSTFGVKSNRKFVHGRGAQRRAETRGRPRGRRTETREKLGFRPDRNRYAPSLHNLPSQPFRSADDAWLWYMRCQEARDEGATMGGGDLDFSRPCDIDDIYRMVKSLYLDGRLQRTHLTVMFSYGEKQERPDERLSERAAHCALWAQAMARLAVVLASKGLLSLGDQVEDGGADE